MHEFLNIIIYDLCDFDPITGIIFLNGKKVNLTRKIDGGYTTEEQYRKLIKYYKKNKNKVNRIELIVICLILFLFSFVFDSKERIFAWIIIGAVFLKNMWGYRIK